MTVSQLLEAVMASSSWETAISALLASEGGYVNHPDDPGGPTKWGITLADAQRFWKGGATAGDLRQMPESTARRIYRDRYWNALRCDDLPNGVDFAVFDYGVNSGTGRAGKVLRRVLGLRATSNVIDDDIVAATHAGDPEKMISAICDERMAFLRGLKTFPVFGRGWTRRVTSVRGIALALHAGTASMPLPRPSQGKAVVPVGKTGRNVTVGAVVVAGSATAAASQGVGVWLAVAAATLAASVVVILVWRWRRRLRQEAVAPIVVMKEDMHGLV